jgi:hypothetical protein
VQLEAGPCRLGQEPGQGVQRPVGCRRRGARNDGDQAAGTRRAGHLDHRGAVRRPRPGHRAARGKDGECEHRSQRQERFAFLPNPTTRWHLDLP